MLKRLIIILILVSVNYVGAQNLVRNGDFETFSGLPTGPAMWNLAPDWNNVNGNLGLFISHASPDYFHRNASQATVSLDTTFSGVVDSKPGDAVMGLAIGIGGIIPNYREYISSQLMTPMKAGVEYEVSFSISNGAEHTEIQGSGCGSDYFGVHLSDTAMVQNGYEVISVSPTFEIDTLFYSTRWQRISFRHIPVKDLNYITLGNFRLDSELTEQCFFQPPTPYTARSYYFLDDIEIKSIESCDLFLSIVESTDAGCDRTGSTKGSATANASGSNGPFIYSWNTTPAQEDSIAVALQAGDYTVTVTDSRGCTKTDTVIIQDRVLATIVSDTASCSTCNDGSALVVIDSSTAVPPYTYRWDDVNEQTTAGATGLLPGNYSVTITDSLGCFKVYSIVIDHHVGIENASASAVKVYPNPVNGMVNIQTELHGSLTIEVVDIRGKLVIRELIRGSSRIDLTACPKGIYFLKLNTGKEIYRHKLIVN